MDMFDIRKAAEARLAEIETLQADLAAEAAELREMLGRDPSADVLCAASPIVLIDAPWTRSTLPQW